jgi:tetratricopeptide (TPR) repeat protein
LQDNTLLRKDTEKLPIEEINFLYDMGVLFYNTGKYEESIECFDKIIEINPASKTAFGYKGLSLQKLKRNQEAIHCYEKALIY